MEEEYVTGEKRQLVLSTGETRVPTGLELKFHSSGRNWEGELCGIERRPYLA